MPGPRQNIISGFSIEAVRAIDFAVINSIPKKPFVGSNFEVPQTKDQDAPIRKSLLGTGVFSDLNFGPAPIINGVQLPEFIPLDCVLFTVNQTKNIVKTIIQGRNGSVKEYISDGDFSINIKIAISGDYGVYPQEQMENLLTYLNAPGALPINSKFLQTLGIYNVVVESYDVNQKEGHYSTQLVDIKAVSDFPVILAIPK